MLNDHSLRSVIFQAKHAACLKAGIDVGNKQYIAAATIPEQSVFMPPIGFCLE